MQNTEIINAYSYVSSLMVLVAVHSTQIFHISILVDAYLVNGTNAYTFISIPCLFGCRVASSGYKSVLASMIVLSIREKSNLPSSASIKSQ